MREFTYLFACVQWASKDNPEWLRVSVVLKFSEPLPIYSFHLAYFFSLKGTKNNDISLHKKLKRNKQFADIMMN